MIILFLSIIEWLGLLVRTVSAGILIYELITLLPAPFGYFHYGWWKLGYSAIVDPVLFFILLKYYKLLCLIEMKMIGRI